MMHMVPADDSGGEQQFQEQDLDYPRNNGEEGLEAQNRFVASLNLVCSHFYAVV
jgi:hypothetical protein